MSVHMYTVGFLVKAQEAVLKNQVPESCFPDSLLSDA